MSTHSFFIRIRILCIFSSSFFLVPYLSAQECCENTDCNRDALNYAHVFIDLTESFPEAPSGRDAILSTLSIIEGDHPVEHDAFMSKIDEFKPWSESHHMGMGCFASNAFELPGGFKAVDYVDAAVSLRVKSAYRSSQFCRGFRFHLEGGLGVANLGKTSESFYSTLRALVSYTFAPTDPATAGDPALKNCNGRFRLLTGLSEAYVSRAGITQGLLRAEIRLRDIKTEELGALANIKLILQGSQGITRHMTSYGGGIGLEFEFGGLNLLYERHNRFAKSSLQLNMAYTF